jgi:hypothetical protein
MFSVDYTMARSTKFLLSINFLAFQFLCKDYYLCKEDNIIYKLVILSDFSQLAVTEKNEFKVDFVSTFFVCKFANFQT